MLLIELFGSVNDVFTVCHQAIPIPRGLSMCCLMSPSQHPASLVNNSSRERCEFTACSFPLAFHWFKSVPVTHFGVLHSVCCSSSRGRTRDRVQPLGIAPARRAHHSGDGESAMGMPPRSGDPRTRPSRRSLAGQWTRPSLLAEKSWDPCRRRAQLLLEDMTRDGALRCVAALRMTFAETGAHPFAPARAAQ